MNSNEQKEAKQNSTPIPGVDERAGGGTRDSGKDLHAPFLSQKEPQSYTEYIKETNQAIRAFPYNEEDLATSSLQGSCAFEEAIAKGFSYHRAQAAGAIGQIGYLLSLPNSEGQIEDLLQKEILSHYQAQSAGKKEAPTGFGKDLKKARKTA